MGREVRRVPPDWEHPRGTRGEYEPLYDGYNEQVEAWEAKYKKSGLQATIDYYGSPPDKNDFMPDWPESERTHFQMYETCTEGTPISPVLESAEVLAHWLADNNASAFADDGASYEAWLAMIKGSGHSISMVMQVGKDGSTEITSGVEFEQRLKAEEAEQ